MSELDDPRVLFAAERTLLAWNRTSIALIAFGFFIERSALFAQTVVDTPGQFETNAAVWIGLAFVTLGAVLAVLSIIPYRQALKTLKPGEIPRGYFVHLAVFANAFVALLGAALALYLLAGLPD